MEKALACDSFKSHISTTATASLLQTRTGECLDWQQVHYLKRKEENQLVLTGGGSGTAPTNADRLLTYLSSDPTKSFVMLYGDYNSGMLTIKTKRMNMNNALEIDEYVDESGDAVDSPEKYAQSMRARLKNANGQILLACAWTSDDARRKFDMYPEWAGGDDTEDTNSEERPLFTCMGMDHENNTFPIMLAYLPAKGQWVYWWLWKDAIPLLHPGTALQRVRGINSDADPQLTRAIEGVIKIGLYPNALHGWCTWHKINRNFTNDPQYKSLLANAKNINISSRIEVDVVVRWLWYFVKHYEDQSEIELSMMLMKHYLGDEDSQDDHIGQIPQDTRRKIMEFCTKSFFLHATKLFEANFTGMTLKKRTTGANEGTHRALKKHVNGPKPQDNLAESCGKINHMNDNKEKIGKKKTASHDYSQYGKAEDRMSRPIELSEHCNDKLAKEHREHTNYLIYRKGENEFYVKRDYDRFDTSPQDDLSLEYRICQRLLDNIENHLHGVDDTVVQGTLRKLREKLLGDRKGSMPEYRILLAEAMKYVIPRYEHTRILKMEQAFSGDLVLTCSCPGFPKMGHACRHMYALLRRHPSPRDAKIRWHVGYANNYGDDKELTKQYMNLRDKLSLRGVVLTPEERTKIKQELYPIGAGDRDYNFFMCSLGRLKLRGQENYWHQNAMKLPQHLRSRLPYLAEKSPTADNEGIETGVAFEVDEEQVAHGPDLSFAVPFGASQGITQLSQYTVPSQIQHELEPNHPVSVCPPQGASSYNDFLHIYQDLCKMADGNGQEGRQSLLDGLNELRTNQFVISGVSANENGMASFPKTSRKKVAKRIKKVTSPNKRR
ncbi:hypothetical protein ACHAXR_009346 [Thalassiosira sp. AJA248-18]